MKKIKALVIAPYRGLVELTSNLKDQLDDFEVTVIQGDLSEPLPVHQYEKEGYDIIISRGGTARLIRKLSSLPVVEIKISGFDILRLITLLKEYKIPIEMIGFPNIIEAVVAVSRLLDVDIPYTIINEQDDVNEVLEAARDKGALVIVGGTNTVRLAKEQGLQGILITSGKESVLEAFENARNVCQAVSRYKAEGQMLNSLAQGAEQGMAVMQTGVRLHYMNAAFRDMLGIRHDQDADVIMRQRFPKLLALMTNSSGKEGEASSFELYDMTFRHKLTVICGEGEPEAAYNLYVRPVTDNENDIQVRRLEPFIETFPRLIRARSDFQEALASAAERLQRVRPLAVYGEQGTGKRIFAGTVWRQLHPEGGELLEVNVVRGSEEAFMHLKHLLGEALPGSMIYLRGAERLSPKYQRRLAESVPQCAAYLICSFEKAPGQLREEGLLEPELLSLIEGAAVEMKPLRTNPQELEELIRIFISENNEKYGKQVVGIRPKAQEALYEYPWKGNLIELRDTVKELVKAAEGEYIDEELLAVLEKQRIGHGPASGARTINLDQPLQSIQKEIIQLVLQEENMNQSRAAKRLGINRSTLWRILKDPI
ncbi:PrpR N-terminal domain-containing protein [Paenibacillus sp. OAS669]|uniref:PrpR N-terminal domain-containing protein n=1 Tax=Paenibacillus sp. OAS669 TaxID=2663821 RepID=UPI00178A8208|nr:PrpR N-terminal domain-containing protein [Paenibacillus sp. OAS669]MBE1444208.1 transcriptional regulator with PAS, ATPase and Fis domain [Paenibacillus sp. OAS669]